MLLAAVAVQTTLVRVQPAWRVPLVIVTYGAAGGWTILNLCGRARAVQLALGLVAAGWALNLAVMAPNQGMPVSTRALERLGVSTKYDVARGHLSKHVISDSGTPLGWLGDTIAVPPLRAVISVGDLVLAIGIAALVTFAMGTRLSRRRLVVAVAEVAG